MSSVLPDQPLVSVILPTFNRRTLLPDAVESIRQQTYTNWEMVIVDDGSTDGTHQYLATLSDSRIRVIFQSHRGNIAAVRNAGIAESTGTFVSFLDSDDVLMKRSLEMHVTQLLLNPDKEWCYGRHQLMDVHGHDIGEPIGVVPGLPSGYIVRDILMDRAAPCTGAVMIRRTLITKAGMFDETLTFAEDFDLWLRLALAGPAVAIDAPLARVRQHDNRTTSRIPDMARSKVIVLAKIREMVAEEDIRRMCTQIRGDHLIKHAAVVSRQNAPRQALRILTRAMPARGTSYTWWRELAKILVRPMIRRTLWSSRSSTNSPSTNQPRGE